MGRPRTAKPGDRFGKVTVLSNDGYEPDTGYAWLRCRCDCGAEVRLRVQRAKSGFGCDDCVQAYRSQKMRQQIRSGHPITPFPTSLPSFRETNKCLATHDRRGDLTGLRWDGRHVLGRINMASSQGAVWYRVECEECGGVAKMPAMKVAARQKCRCRKRLKVRVGARFGFWLVLAVEVRCSASPSIKGQKGTYVLIRCICGHEAWRLASAVLNTRGTKSCRACFNSGRTRGAVAVVPKWGVVTRLFRPGLALGTIIGQRPQKSQRRSQCSWYQGAV